MNTDEIITEWERNRNRHPLNGEKKTESFISNMWDESASNYDFHRYNRSYDNTKKGFGYTTYMNSYDTVWTLSTGWLSDEESERFAKHVMGSTQVWLQDIERGVTYPVYMLDTSTEYKKYDGKTLICYTVKLGLSQERKRK